MGVSLEKVFAFMGAHQGRRQKIFQRGNSGKKDRKLAKNTEK